jgi:hypothetical protein
MGYLVASVWLFACLIDLEGRFAPCGSCTYQWLAAVRVAGANVTVYSLHYVVSCCVSARICSACVSLVTLVTATALAQCASCTYMRLCGRTASSVVWCLLCDRFVVVCSVSRHMLLCLHRPFHPPLPVCTVFSVFVPNDSSTSMLQFSSATADWPLCCVLMQQHALS